MYKRQIPTYGRAWRLKQKLEKVMAEKNISFEDDDNLYLDTPLDAKVEDDNELPPVTADTPEEAREKAAEEKKQGDAHFLGKRHEQACERWGRAIELLKAHDITDVSVAKLYSNRAAAHLALKKHVLAARDGALAVECDAGWWKGHWYFGQATLELVKPEYAVVSLPEFGNAVAYCATRAFNAGFGPGVEETRKDAETGELAAPFGGYSAKGLGLKQGAPVAFRAEATSATVQEEVLRVCRPEWVN